MRGDACDVIIQQVAKPDEVGVFCFPANVDDVRDYLIEHKGYTIETINNPWRFMYSHNVSQWDKWKVNKGRIFQQLLNGSIIHYLFYFLKI